MRTGIVNFLGFQYGRITLPQSPVGRRLLVRTVLFVETVIAATVTVSMVFT
jgi:hypothetical protein